MVVAVVAVVVFDAVVFIAVVFTVVVAVFVAVVVAVFVVAYCHYGLTLFFEALTDGLTNSGVTVLLQMSIFSRPEAIP